MALFVCSKCRTLDYSELILQDVKFVSVKRPVSFMPGKKQSTDQHFLLGWVLYL